MKQSLQELSCEMKELNQVEVVAVRDDLCVQLRRANVGLGSFRRSGRNLVETSGKASKLPASSCLFVDQTRRFYQSETIF